MFYKLKLLYEEIMYGMQIQDKVRIYEYSVLKYKTINFQVLNFLIEIYFIQ